MKKYFPLLSAMMVFFNAFGENPKRGSATIPFFEQGMALSENRYPKGYNAPGRIAIQNGWNFDIEASFLYWHASQEWMDIADRYASLSQTPETIAYQPFDYKPGFKVGAGWKTNYDAWSFRAEYARFHQTTNYSSTLPSGSYWNLPNWFDLFDLAQISLGSGLTTYFPQSLSSSWTLQFDLLDLAAARAYYQGKAISVSPYAGLRALWIAQTMQIAANPNTSSSATSANDSNCWSLGPNMGIQGNWLLSYGFRLEGLASASLLYTRYTKLTTHQSLSSLATVGSSPIQIHASADVYNALRPTLEIGFGMGWGSYFNKNSCFFDLSARYDFLQFWSQNMMRYWASALYGSPDPIGDLQLHGLTATVRLDF